MRPRTATLIAALVVLGAILVLAAVLRADVTVVYEESGSGCREPTAASASELADALLPVQLLLMLWVLTTGLLVTRPLATRAARRSATVWAAGGVVAVGLTAAQPFFIGTDPLSAFLPLLAVGLLVFIGAFCSTVMAVRRRQLSRQLGVWTGWLLVAGIAVPLAMLALTGDGAIRSC